MRPDAYGKKIKDHPLFLLLAVFALILIIVPALAPMIAPNDPLQTDYQNAMVFFHRNYLLGTDQIGRCILSRLIWGGRSTLLITFSVIGIISVAGSALGMAAGYFGGWTDFIISKVTDMALAIPSTVFIIAVVSVLGTGKKNTILAMSLVGWTEYCRVMRALVLAEKNNKYVEAAKIGGSSEREIMGRLILPNTIPYLIVNIAQDIGATILTLSGLSLLGLSAQPPQPEWGFMLSEGRKYIQSAPWLIIYPGLMIVLYVVIFNLLGDSLRDILDPRFTKEKKKRRSMKTWLEKN